MPLGSHLNSKLPGPCLYDGNSSFFGGHEEGSYSMDPVYGWHLKMATLTNRKPKLAPYLLLQLPWCGRSGHSLILPLLAGRFPVATEQAEIGELDLWSSFALRNRCVGGTVAPRGNPSSAIWTALSCPQLPFPGCISSLLKVTRIRAQC